MSHDRFCMALFAQWSARTLPAIPVSRNPQKDTGTTKARDFDRQLRNHNENAMFSPMSSNRPAGGLRVRAYKCLWNTVFTNIPECLSNGKQLDSKHRNIRMQFMRKAGIVEGKSTPCGTILLGSIGEKTSKVRKLLSEGLEGPHYITFRYLSLNTIKQHMHINFR